MYFYLVGNTESCIFVPYKNKETMTTFNKTMTIEEATKLYQSKSGMNYPNTEHNRKVMKQVIDNHLKSLRNAN